MNARHLYVHVPFCARRCTYCDFSIAVRKRTPVAEYLSGLARELGRVGAPRDLATVYLGGGTPSRLGGEGIAQLARLLGPQSGVAEFTIEANPDDVTPDAVRTWVAAGVNRLSLGAQSFAPRVLAWMHRTHQAGTIGQAVGIARANGISNISLDLIFSLPETLDRDWPDDLARAVALEPDHISLYGLTVEQGTPLARQIGRGDIAAADAARYEADYLLAHQSLGTAGFRFYEVSNAARPGREAVHNRAYWRRVPYLGVGPSAHSYDGASRWWNEAAYARWVARLMGGESPIAGREVLAEPQLELEQLYLGLRTGEGITVDGELGERMRKAATRWQHEGWAILDVVSGLRSAVSVRLTPLGWLRLDVLVASL